MSGWHSACETTFEHKDRTYSQIWCCPAGEFGCHLREPRIGPDTTWRACTSTVLDPTAYEAKTTTSADGMGWGYAGPVSSVVIKTTPGEEPYIYWVLPIPLQLPAKTTVPGSSSVISTEAIAYPTVSADTGSGAGEASSSSAADGTRHLSKGSLAGAISASILAALIAAAMVYVCIRRRRRRVQASKNAVIDQDQRVDPYYGKPELPTTDITRAELPGGYGMCSEMDGWSRPAEVPTTAGPEAYVKDAVSPEEEEEEEASRSDAVVYELPSPSTRV
ncbi:hypothetical protein PG993_006278 [Apiospora rasikravindrae]|uniref:Uncharacterized protein n=1 Tax=Apiospora rasikravindrae TaxID=990691 RepID=A0ABR1T586_9PEZI